MSEWTGYRLVPDDVLFLRDGKPSTMGEDHYLGSIFPPNPSTLYGAVRTARLMEEGVELRGLNESKWKALEEDFRAEIGEWGGFGKLELRGPLLMKDGEALFPAPADLGVTTSTDAPRAPVKVTEVCRFRPDPPSSPRWSHRYRPLRPYRRSGAIWEPWSGAILESSAGWFISPAGMKRWLDGRVPEPPDFLSSSDLWLTEVRSGVGLKSDLRIAGDGLLYTFGFVRLRPGVSIGFELGNGYLDPPAFVHFGGEGKTASIVAGKTIVPSLPVPPSAAGIATVYLGTPAFSRSGAEAPQRLGGAIAAAVSGAALIGGWDLALGKAKPLRRAIPAGSVFFIDHNANDRVASLHGENISDDLDSPAALQGYGLALVGTSD